MTIHFVCRGNFFRSIIAEAYLRSLAMPGVVVSSSGTVASEHIAGNQKDAPIMQALLERHGLKSYAKDAWGDDIHQEAINESSLVIVMNQRVYDEAKTKGIILPNDTEIWSISDVGENGRIAEAPADRARYYEMGYEEIIVAVDDLVRRLSSINSLE